MALTKAPEELLARDLTSALSITTADNTSQLTLTSTDTDANVGPRMDLTRDSSSPAASDSLGQIRFMGEDAGDNSISYAHMTSFIVDPTDGSEDGKFEIDVRKAGTQRSRLLLDENETVFNNEQQDIDFRVESDNNANMFLVDAGNDRIQVANLLLGEITGSTDVIQSTSSDGLLIDVAGDITLDADGADINLKDGGTQFGKIYKGGGSDLVIDASIADKDIIFTGTDGSSAITALTLDMSNAGAATFNSNVVVNGVLQLTDVAQSIDFIQSGAINFDSNADQTNRVLTIGSNRAGGASGGISNVKFDETGSTVFNEGGVAADVRVESQHLTHLLFCDGTNSKVGIGQSSPDNRLHVVDSTSHSIAPLVIGNEDNTAATTQKVRLGFGLSRDSGTVKNDAGEIEVGKDNQWDATDNNVDSYMAFRTYKNNSATEQCRVTSAGMFLINATSNINSGGGNKAGLCVRGAGGGPHVMTLRNFDTSGGANQIEFQDGDGDVCGAINANATSNTTSYGTSSDYRLKENVSAVSGAIDKLKLLEPKTYNFISDSSKTKEDGFLAHELAEVIPNAVTGEKDAVHDNGEMDIQQVDYGKLTPLLTAALQEAIEKIETLQAEVAALKGE